MKNQARIYGSLVQAYLICKKQAWFLSRNLSGDPDNVFLEIGRLISENSYSREKRQLYIEGVGILDFVKIEGEKIVFAEVKKSSRALKSAEYQLLFYIYKLKERMNIKRGEIRIPKEKKVKVVTLTPEKEAKLQELEKEILNTIESETPPKSVKNKFCEKCSYQKLCWS